MRRPSGRSRALAGAGLLSLLASCAQQGDFGRAAPSAWNGLIETTGALSARVRGEPASAFPFTDDEIALRDRAWRFLMPAAPREAFLDVVANLTRTRVLPPSWRWPEVSDYHDGLMADSGRSSVSRYRRLGDDATADARLIPPFAATAARVIEADALRLRSLPFVKTLEDDDVREAAMRVGENRCLIAWVRLSALERAEGYRYSLEHLLVEVPSAGEAASAERALVGLSERRAGLDPLLPADAAIRCGLVPPPPASARAAPARLVVKD